MACFPMDTYQAWRSDKLFELGGGHVVICRKRGDGRVQAAMIMLDVYCLGVRDAFLTEESESGFEELLERIQEKDPLVPCSPAYARKVIDESIAFAGQFGFAPHRDFRKVRKVLNRVDPGECDEVIPMGKNGKPFYIQTQSHDDAFAKRVVAALERKLGIDGFDYILSMSDDDEDENWYYEEDDEDPYVLLSEYPRSPEVNRLSRGFVDDLHGIMGDMELDIDERSPAFAEILVRSLEITYETMREELKEDGLQVTFSQFIEISIMRLQLGMLRKDEKKRFLEDLEKTDPEAAANLNALLLEDEERFREAQITRPANIGRFVHWRVTPPQTPNNPGDIPHVMIAYTPEN